MVRTLEECEGLTSDNDDIPPDVLPLAIWFDDVADLSVGIGYFTEDAYDNRLSKHRTTQTFVVMGRLGMDK